MSNVDYNQEEKENEEEVSMADDVDDGGHIPRSLIINPNPQ